MKSLTLFILHFLICVACLFPQTEMTVAVLSLEPHGFSISDAEVLTSRLRSLLVDQGSYVVVDRQNMEEILLEQDFQLTGCTSDECAVSVGRLLGVKKIITGSVGTFGKITTIELHLIDVETGKVESSTIYDNLGPMESLLLEGIDVALTKLLRNKQYTSESTKLGLFRISVFPPESSVIVDDNILNDDSTRLRTFKLPFGKHKVQVSAPLYYMVIKDIKIIDETISTTIDLEYGGDELNDMRTRIKRLGASSIASISLAIGSAIIANISYGEYNNSTNIEDAQKYRDLTEVFDRATVGLSMVAAGISCYTLWYNRKMKKLRREINANELH